MREREKCCSNRWMKVTFKEDNIRIVSHWRCDRKPAKYTVAPRLSRFLYQLLRMLFFFLPSFWQDRECENHLRGTRCLLDEQVEDRVSFLGRRGLFERLHPGHANGSEAVHCLCYLRWHGCAGHGLSLVSVADYLCEDERCGWVGGVALAQSITPP